MILSITNLYKKKSLERNILQHLSSLEKLEFTYRRRLQSLPEDTFPSSLKVLSIKERPVLEERYQKQEHWSKIAHITVKIINDPSHNMSPAKRKMNSTLIPAKRKMNVTIHEKDNFVEYQHFFIHIELFLICKKINHKAYFGMEGLEKNEFNVE